MTQRVIYSSGVRFEYYYCYLTYLLVARAPPGWRVEYINLSEKEN